MFGISFGELLIVFLVGLFVFGPDKLPQVIRTVMQWIDYFRRLSMNIQNELSKELQIDELKQQFDDVKNEFDFDELEEKINDEMDKGTQFFNKTLNQDELKSNEKNRNE